MSTTPTDLQLQLALAKMLPEKIITEQQLSGYNFWWNNNLVGTDDIERVKETEWLHVCWLVEQYAMSHWEPSMWQQYCKLLDEHCTSGHNRSASWQQRALALCKVKGVEI